MYVRLLHLRIYRKNVGFHAFVANVYATHVVYKNIYMKYPQQTMLYIMDKTISFRFHFFYFIKILKCIKSASQQLPNKKVLMFLWHAIRFHGNIRIFITEYIITGIFLSFI